MATNTMDENVDRTDTDQAKDNGQSKETDLSSENASLRERLMRALAETENTRRQGERRAQDAQKYAITDFARELLQVVDNLRRAIEVGSARADAKQGDGLMDGVVAIDRMLSQLLQRFGVQEMNALNAPFDPEKHEAVMEVDATDQPARSVVEVLENGYTLHDRLLRPARVAVARPQQPASQAAEQ
jgi:molecular chaperone GrpE